MVHSHRQCGDGATAPLQPQEAEEICLVTQNPDQLLQMHNREHPVGLYHSLVRQLHRPQHKALQRVVCTTHQRGQTTCPPWHLQHPLSQERQKDQGQQPPKPLSVHTAIIQKASSVQVHQSWDRDTEKLLLSQGHQTAKQQSLTQSGYCLHWDPITGLFNKWITNHFKQW